MTDDRQDDLLTVGEARELLGVSARKLTQLIADGTLTAESDPLDKRVKLLHRAQVEALIVRSKRERAA